MIVSKREELYDIAHSVLMKTPIDPKVSNWDVYGHFELFCASQIGSPIPNREALIANAKLIATLHYTEVDLITRSKLIKMGFIVGNGKV